MKKALLIIDVQNDYFPNGKCELYNSNTALSEIKVLLNHFRKNDLPVYFIQHISTQGATFFEPNTEGVNIHKDIEPFALEKVIVKHYPNSFYKTDLQAELNKEDITQLVICGMMTHMCVDTTVRSAKDLGYDNILISDACSTKSLEWNGTKIPAQTVQDVYMASIDQKFAKVLTCKEYLMII